MLRSTKVLITRNLPLVSNSGLVVNENLVHVKTLERCFNEKIDREMSNNVVTVEGRIENAILTAIDSIVAPKIKLAIRSKKCILRMRRDQCHNKFRTWGAFKENCPF